jgi:hypothetical protein
MLYPESEAHRQHAREHAAELAREYRSAQPRQSAGERPGESALRRSYALIAVLAGRVHRARPSRAQSSA